MQCARTLRLIAAICACLLMPSLCEAKKPPGPGGGGGGGGKPLTNPAWVIEEDNNIKLLSLDGKQKQTIAGGGAVQRYAPEFSPDGAWVAFIQRDDQGWTISRARVDGSREEEVVRFPANSGMGPRWWSQLAWVPGEVDRIVYSGGNVGEFYVVSTVNGGPPTLLGLFGDGATLSPDREPETPGYQGAIAYSSGLLNVLLLEDTPDGLVVDLDSRQTFWSLGRTQRLPAWSNSGFEIAMLYGDENLGDGGSDWGTSVVVLPVLVDSTGIGLLENSLRVVHSTAWPDINIYRPTWSPDDSSLAFVSRVRGSYDLYLTAADGASAPVKITRKGGVAYPHWNPAWDSGSP